MKTLIITSNCLRHLAFLSRIKKEIDITHAILVSKLSGIDEFRRVEMKYFGDVWLPLLSEGHPTYCAPKDLHSPEMIERIKDINPDICFVFGAPLLKEEIYSIPKLGCINIHTGLVEKYRGVDSAYWALYDERPQDIGVTVHYIDKSIDGGDVLLQSKTRGLSKNDSPEDIFMKTCKTGFDLLAENVYNILNNKIKSKPLLSRGKLFQNKDMSPEVMQEIRQKTKRIMTEFVDGNNS